MVICAVSGFMGRLSGTQREAPSAAALPAVRAQRFGLGKVVHHTQCISAHRLVAKGVPRTAPDAQMWHPQMSNMLDKFSGLKCVTVEGDSFTSSPEFLYLRVCELSGQLPCSEAGKLEMDFGGVLGVQWSRKFLLPCSMLVLGEY